MKAWVRLVETCLPRPCLRGSQKEKCRVAQGLEGLRSAEDESLPLTGQFFVQLVPRKPAWLEQLTQLFKVHVLGLQKQRGKPGVCNGRGPCPELAMDPFSGLSLQGFPDSTSVVVSWSPGQH